MRNTGENVNGGGWAESDLLKIWKKGKIVGNNDPAIWRKDRCDAWMRYSGHGSAGKYGWEVDHINPVANGGTDLYSNLQPLQWENNRHKGDNYPNWSCKIDSTDQE